MALPRWLFLLGWGWGILVIVFTLSVCLSVRLHSKTMYLNLCTDWKLAKWIRNQQNWKSIIKFTYMVGIFTILLVHVERENWHMYFGDIVERKFLLLFSFYSCLCIIFKFYLLFCTHIILLSNSFLWFVLCTVISHRRSLFSVSLVCECPQENSLLIFYWN